MLTAAPVLLISATRKICLTLSSINSISSSFAFCKLLTGEPLGGRKEGLWWQLLLPRRERKGSSEWKGTVATRMALLQVKALQLGLCGILPASRKVEDLSWCAYVVFFLNSIYFFFFVAPSSCRSLKGKSSQLLRQTGQTGLVSTTEHFKSRAKNPTKSIPSLSPTKHFWSLSDFSSYNSSHVLSTEPSVCGSMHERQQNDSWDPLKVLKIQHELQNDVLGWKNNKNTPNKWNFPCFFPTLSFSALCLHLLYSGKNCFHPCPSLISPSAVNVLRGTVLP